MFKMTVPLIDKCDGDFRKVCEKYADHLKSALGKRREAFIDWMMLSKDYSESQWKQGMMGDPFLYLHCFSIYNKLRGGSNQHHIVLVSGKIGKGKSTLGAQIAALVDPTLSMERICYIPPHFFKRLGISKAAEGNLIDEGGNFFKARNAMTTLGKDISQAFQLVRDLQQLIVVCYDEPEKLDKDLIDKIDSLFVKVYDPDQNGDNKYNGYYAFNVKNLELVKPYLKKKLPIFSKECQQHISWRGRNSKEMPKINDINEKIYRSEKRKYLKDHMVGLADKYAKEYEDKLQPAPEQPKLTPEWVTVTQASKINSCNPETIRRKIKTGILKYKKIGNKYMVPKELPDFV